MTERFPLTPPSSTKPQSTITLIQFRKKHEFYLNFNFSSETINDKTKMQIKPYTTSLRIHINCKSAQCHSKFTKN